MQINSWFVETMIRRKCGQKAADWLFVSCFLYLLLSVVCDYTTTTASDDVFFINQHNNNASSNLTLNKCNSSSIEYKLENGANCSLSWSYDEQENYLEFVLEFDTPREATWIAIGFNKIKKMIGTSVIMIKIEDNNIEIFNGYLKYYNRPLIENYFIRNARKSDANGKTVIKFSRNVSLPTIGHVSLNQCNYLVVASGPIQNRVISNHLNVPKFTDECYNLVVNCSNSTDPTSDVTAVPTSTKPNADLKVKKLILDSLRSNHAKHVVKSLSFNMNDLLHKRRSTTLATTTTATERTTNSSEWDIDSDITIDLILGGPLRGEFASSSSLSTSTSTSSTTKNEPDVSTTIEIPTSRPEGHTTVTDRSLSTSTELTTGYAEEKTQSTTDLISTTTTLLTTTTTNELISTTYTFTTSLTSNYSTINLSNQTEHTTHLMTSSLSALTSSNTTFASSTFNLSSVSFNPTLKQEHQQSGLKDAPQLTLESFIIVAVLNQSFDDTLNDPTSPAFKSLNENVQNYLKLALEINGLMGYNDSKVTNVSPTKDNLQRITAILLYLNDESLVPQAEMRNTIHNPEGFPLKIESVSISYTTSESSSKAARKNVEVIFILSSVLGTIALLLLIGFFLMIYYLYRKKMSYNLNNSRRLDKIKLANLIRI